MVRSRCKEAGDTARGGADRYGVVWRSKYEPGGLETALLARRPALAPALQGLLGLRTKLQVRAPNDISTFLYDVSERDLQVTSCCVIELLSESVAFIKLNRGILNADTRDGMSHHVYIPYLNGVISARRRVLSFNAYLLSRERANSTNVVCLQVMFVFVVCFIASCKE